MNKMHALSLLLISFAHGQFKVSNHIHRCELYALTSATKLADLYNAPMSLVDNSDPNSGYDHDLEERLYQDWFVEHVGFSGFLQKGVSSDVKKGMTTSGVNVAAALMKRNKWIGTELSQSPYSPFKDLWIYMVGDSTTRQLFTHFGNPIHGSGFGQNSKEWSREKCMPQWPHHRKHHHAGGHFPDEGWSGNCGNNELTCHIQGFGKEGVLTFDWKHFPFEDYDDYMWGETGPFGSAPEGITITSTAGHEMYANRSSAMRDKDSYTARRLESVPATADHENKHRAKRRPDILTIQTGLHTCVHARYNHKDAFNYTQMDRYINDLPKLMDAVARVVHKRDAAAAMASEAQHKNTTVIWVTSGRVGHRMEGLPMDDHDSCVWKFNAHARRLAHRYGFAVLEREEIERRLLYASQNHEKKVPKSEFLRFKMHLEAPAPQIVSTALLHLVSCLRNDSFFGGLSYVKSPWGQSDTCNGAV